MTWMSCLHLAISLATRCAGIAPTHIAPGYNDDDDGDDDDNDDDDAVDGDDDDNEDDNDDNGGDDDDNDDDDDDDEDDNDDGPEVLSAARHAQHDQPGQTHARQPANDCFISIIVFILS